MFCFKNKISLNQYLNFKNGYMYSWLNHYREHRINPYGLMELGNLNNVFSLLSEDEQDLYSNTLLNKIETFKVRYHNSPKTKEYVKTITKKIEDFLKRSCTNKKICYYKIYEQIYIIIIRINQRST